MLIWGSLLLGYLFILLQLVKVFEGFHVHSAEQNEKAHGQRIHSIKFHPEHEHVLVSGGWDNTLKVGRAGDGNQLGGISYCLWLLWHFYFAVWYQRMPMMIDCCYAEFISGNSEYICIYYHFVIEIVMLVVMLPCRRQRSTYPELFNAMAADDLVMQGARVLAVIVLT